MTDLVGTCPMSFWFDWIAEGDAAGDPYTGEEWGWYTAHRDARLIMPGDRFYVVAHGRLRGYAPVTRLIKPGEELVLPKGGGALVPVDRFVICRRGGAQASTIEDYIPGFRGLRTRWWPRSIERPFPEWKTADIEPRRRTIQHEAKGPLL